MRKFLYIQGEGFVNILTVFSLIIYLTAQPFYKYIHYNKYEINININFELNIQKRNKLRANKKYMCKNE